MAKRKASPEDVSKAVEDLIQAYMETGDVQHLTDYAVLTRIGISSRTLDSYYDGEADKRLLDDDKLTETERVKYTKSGYCDAVKRLIEFRRSECVKNIVGNTAANKTTGWIFLSKQARWGGLQDVQRVEKTGNQSLSIQLVGQDGKALRSE